MLAGEVNVYFVNLLTGQYIINPNKAGLFEGSFFWGGQFDPPFIFQEELI